MNVDKRRIIISLLEYFFPPRCALCNTLLKAGVPIYICEKCLDEIGYYNNCVNSLNLPQDMETFCDGMICVGRYSGSLKSSLKRFKFSDKPSYYRAFGRLLALKVQNTVRSVSFNMVVPVPLHKSKQRQRGYNQAALTAYQTAKLLGLPCSANILAKVSATKSQSMLSRNDRLSNVEDSFKVINEKALYKKNILIVDDIVTTGSTINQCCKVLKQAGAGIVIAGVIATTRRDC